MKYPRYLYVGSRFRLGCSSCYSNAQLPLFSSQAPERVGIYEALQQIGLSVYLVIVINIWQKLSSIERKETLIVTNFWQLFS